MMSWKIAALAAGTFALGLWLGSDGSTAEAHGYNLTRLDVRNAVLESMRSMGPQGMKPQDVEQVVRRTLAGCTFRGQMRSETTSQEDSFDFQGRLIC